MTRTKHAKNETQNTSQKPDAIVGAGRLVSEIRRSRNGRVDFNFNVFSSEKDSGEVSQLFQSSDVADLARLAQLIAAEIARDGTLGEEACGDLQCLAACLEQVLPTGYVFPGIYCPFDGPGFRAIVVLLAWIWDEAEKDFAVDPSHPHVYCLLVSIDAWIRGVGPTGGIGIPNVDPNQVEDHFGGCPICGSNDGYLNFRRAHWFHCNAHQVRWCAGENLFSTWRNESDGDWNENVERIGQYRVVRPLRNPSDCNNAS